MNNAGNTILWILGIIGGGLVLLFIDAVLEHLIPVVIAGGVLYYIIKWLASKSD